MKHLPTAYCLRCYEPISVRGASAPCPRCDTIVLREDQRVFWSQQPLLLTVEHALKGLVVLIIIALMGAIIWALFNQTVGPRAGMALLFPPALGALLWDMASGVTRRETTWSGSLVVSAVLGVLGGVLLLIGLLAISESASRQAAILSAVGSGLLVAALGSQLAGHGYRAWSRRHVQRRQAALSPLIQLPGSPPATSE